MTTHDCKVLPGSPSSTPGTHVPLTPPVVSNAMETPSLRSTFCPGMGLLKETEAFPGPVRAGLLPGTSRPTAGSLTEGVLEGIKGCWQHRCLVSCVPVVSADRALVTCLDTEDHPDA